MECRFSEFLKKNVMKRNNLKVGDRSSAGGTVADAIPGCRHHGTELTFIGARVICPACRTTGRIAPKGPRWPGTMMGKEPALEGDICICKCSPPPVMLASQDTMCQKFESRGLSGMKLADIENSLGHEALTYSQCFKIINSNGEPIEDFPYILRSSHGRTISGMTSFEGITESIFADEVCQIEFILDISKGA